MSAPHPLEVVNNQLLDRSGGLPLPVSAAQPLGAVNIQLLNRSGGLPLVDVVNSHLSPDWSSDQTLPSSATRQLFQTGGDGECSLFLILVSLYCT